MSVFQQVLERARVDARFRKQLQRQPMAALAEYPLSHVDRGMLHSLTMDMAAAMAVRRAS